MLEDISVYKDLKRNEKCPCGSGKIFKKCCMNEYREAKKESNKSNAIVSSCTPLKSLPQEDKKVFLNLYQNLLIFSHQYENNSDIVYIDDENQNVSSFMNAQREYFYANVEEIVDAYIQEKELTTQEIELLENIKLAKFDKYIVMSHRENSAVLMNLDGEMYNIQALDSPFGEIFRQKSKYTGVRTVVISYKDCYIADGLYNVFEIESKIAKELDNVPYSQPQINYSKNKNMTILPLLNHFSIFCSADDFFKMEDIILTKISDTFAKDFLELFDEPYLEKTYIVPAFYRSTDLNEELNNKDGDKKFNIMIGGSPTTNFERGNEGKIIPYEIMSAYYKQKPLKDSASKSVYENIKRTQKNLFSGFASQSSFYTLVAMLNIDQNDIQKYELFLENFNSAKYREKVTLIVEDFFKELSQEHDIDLDVVYLAPGIDLDSIHYEINNYRDYISKAESTVAHAKAYSITKGM